MWLLVMENNEFYNAISAPMWTAALAGSFCGLGYAALRGQRNWNMNVEAKPVWN